ncbi:hypothetical protein LV716_11695 [Flagellimonas sp. HMM57]|uniref:hypothetical protein n=1 Tax=unclassified Flagellimonas TaxID=2644544 RepID=UPI0013D0F90F|nr:MULTISPECIES: hypothetical protein [unclassified Flagellimonas]UII74919.1 hypothetical protein LV716_11695 [Flagellimonas sp. HMM57]
MEDKEYYLRALRKNNGVLNELDLGNQLGFNDTETRHIISLLLSEHKIKYVENETCNYRVVKT